MNSSLFPKMTYLFLHGPRFLACSCVVCSVARTVLAKYQVQNVKGQFIAFLSWLKLLAFKSAKYFYVILMHMLNAAINLSLCRTQPSLCLQTLFVLQLVMCMIYFFFGWIHMNIERLLLQLNSLSYECYGGKKKICDTLFLCTIKLDANILIFY